MGRPKKVESKEGPKSDSREDLFSYYREKLISISEELEKDAFKHRQLAPRLTTVKHKLSNLAKLLK